MLRSSVLSPASVVDAYQALTPSVPLLVPKRTQRKTSINGFTKQLFTSLNSLVVHVVAGHKLRNTLHTNWVERGKSSCSRSCLHCGRGWQWGWPLACASAGSATSPLTQGPLFSSRNRVETSVTSLLPIGNEAFPQNPRYHPYFANHLFLQRKLFSEKLAFLIIN